MRLKKRYEKRSSKTAWFGKKGSKNMQSAFAPKRKVGTGKGGAINPSQIEEGMWVVEDTMGEPLGVYPDDYTEEAMQDIGQGFADQHKEHVIVMRKGEEFEHAHYFPRGKARAVISPNPSERRKNPSTLTNAKALAEKWHGRPADEIIEVVEKEVYDTNLFVLGELVEMTLLDEDGYGTDLRFDKSTLLVGTVDENNMEFVGGDQELPLDELGLETNKHKVNLGQVFSIVYYTDKAHLQGEPKKAIERVHEFNEESKDGDYPELIYDTRNHKMELAGGSYVITEEGIRD